MIIENWYLFLIDKILDYLSISRVFTKINIKNTYYYFWIQRDNEYKITLQIQYRLLKYLVMLFVLINAFASF